MLPAPARRRSRLASLGPWLVATAVLAWLFHIVPVSDLVAAFARAPFVPFVAATIVFVAGMLVADAFATFATFRWALPDARLAFRDVLTLRGASYLLAVLHYGVGQGGLAWFVHRRGGVTLSRAAGAVMLILGVNVIMLTMSAFLGAVLGGAPDAPALRVVVLTLGAAFPAYLAVIAARPRILARRPLLAPLFDAGLRGHLGAAVARLPHLAWLILGHWIVMGLFGVTPPLVRALALMPLVFAVAVLPISPAGLGTAQAVAVAVFTPYATALASPAHGAVDALADARAQVLAYSLGLQFLGLIVQAGLGLVCLRALTRAGTVREGRSRPDAEPRDPLPP